MTKTCTHSSPDFERAVHAFVEHMRASGNKITPREREVLLDLLIFGGTVRETAERLRIGVNTVNNHFKGIFEATGVNSRIELLALFVRETLCTECRLGD